MFMLQLDQVHLACWTQDGIGLIKKSREELRKIYKKLSKCDKLLIYSSDVQNSSELY